MTEAIVTEALLLALIGITGVGMSWLMGARGFLPLVVIGFAASVSLRIITTLATWSVGATSWSVPVWVGVSLGLGAWGLWRGRAHWMSLLIGIAVLGLSSLSVLVTKFVFGIGEKEHTDSAGIVASALVAVQGNRVTPGEFGALIGEKRGPAYPWMLSLGPDERIFATFTPLLFLVTLAAVIWAVAGLSQRGIPLWIYLTVFGVLLSFSMSVPMFRAAMFYLNSHTMMGFGLLLMSFSFLLARRDRTLGNLTMWMGILGGIISATSRSEGIALAAVVLAALVGEQIWNTGRLRIRLGLVLSACGVTFAWWVLVLNSPLAERAPGGAWGLVVFALGLSVLAPMKIWDSLRPAALPLIAIGTFGYLVWVIVSSSNPQALVMTQAPNLLEGAGGWGLAAAAAGISLVLLGWKQQPDSYRQLVKVAIVALAMLFAAKTFDGGGFGRESFFDSLNRMYLHVMPMILTATALGYVSLLQRSFSGVTYPSSIEDDPAPMPTSRREARQQRHRTHS